NGLTKTAQIDSSGVGVFDQTQRVAKVYNSDGSTTVTTTNSRGTSVTGSTVVTTSANGLSSTSTVYNGAGTVLDTRTDTKVVNADGSTTETVSDHSTNGTLIDQTVTAVSSDGMTTTINGANNGGGNTSFEMIVELANG